MRGCVSDEGSPATTPHEGVEPMGRGRAKAKQVKVARQLKYNSGGTDLERLRDELGVEMTPTTMTTPTTPTMSWRSVRRLCRRLRPETTATTGRPAAARRASTLSVDSTRWPGRRVCHVSRLAALRDPERRSAVLGLAGPDRRTGTALSRRRRTAVATAAGAGACLRPGAASPLGEAMQPLADRPAAGALAGPRQPVAPRDPCARPSRWAADPSAGEAVSVSGRAWPLPGTISPSTQAGSSAPRAGQPARPRPRRRSPPCPRPC